MKTKPKSKKATAQTKLNRAAVAWADDAPDMPVDDETCELKSCVRCKLLRAVRAFQKAGK